MNWTVHLTSPNTRNTSEKILTQKRSLHTLHIEADPPKKMPNLLNQTLPRSHPAGVKSPDGEATKATWTLMMSLMILSAHTTYSHAIIKNVSMGSPDVMALNIVVMGRMNGTAAEVVVNCNKQ